MAHRSQFDRTNSCGHECPKECAIRLPFFHYIKVSAMRSNPFLCAEGDWAITQWAWCLKLHSPCETWFISAGIIYLYQEGWSILKIASNNFVYGRTLFHNPSAKYYFRSVVCGSRSSTNYVKKFWTIYYRCQLTFLSETRSNWSFVQFL